MPFDKDSPEFKAAIAEAIEAETKGLKAKIDELLGANKELKTKLRESTGIKPEDLARVEQERDRAIEERDAARNEAKGLKTAVEKATKDLESERASATQTLITSHLSDAMAAVNVAPPFRAAVRALFASQAKVIQKGDAREVMVGDKTASEFFKAWSETDEGKHYIAASTNQGGGAPGSQGSQGAGQRTMKRSEFAKLDPASQSKLGREVHLID